MTTFTRTQWFPASQAPAHDGVYERDMSGEDEINSEVIYSYWDWRINAWLNSATTVEEAANEVNMSDYPVRSSWQDLPWRGIVKDVPDEL